MNIFDLIFYSATKCTFGPDDEHIAAKISVSLFIHIHLFSIVELFFYFLTNSTLDDLFGEEEARWGFLGIWIFIMYLVSRYYDDNMEDVEDASEFMKKHHKDTMPWHLFISLTAFVEPILFGLLVHQCILP